MAVGVDHRVAEARLDPGNVVAGHELHGCLLLGGSYHVAPMGPGGRRVRVEIDGNVAVLTLDDPDRRNALAVEMTNDLAAAVDEVLANPAIGAFVLTATPPVFSAGGSVDDLLSPRVPLRDTYAGFLRVAASPIPTVAAVNGPAIGAGVNLALACDVILTSPAARIDPRFLDIGIHPGGGNMWRLRQLAGRQVAAALVLFGESLTGEDAARVGLAWRCVDDAVLLETAVALARRAADRPREVMARAKSILDASAAVDDSDDAFELELEAQAWSMAQPVFLERVEELRAKLKRPKP